MSGRFARHDLFERNSPSPRAPGLDLKSIIDKHDASSKPPLSGRSLGASSTASRGSIGLPSSLAATPLRQALLQSANVQRPRTSASVRKTFVSSSAVPTAQGTEGSPPTLKHSSSQRLSGPGPRLSESILEQSDAWKIRGDPIHQDPAETPTLLESPVVSASAPSIVIDRTAPVWSSRAQATLNIIMSHEFKAPGDSSPFALRVRPAAVHPGE